MSVHYISAAFRSSRAKGLDRFVLVCLSNYADEQGCCYPSVQTVAKHCGVSDRKAQQSISKLIKIRELRKAKQGGCYNGKNTPNTYRILLKIPGEQYAPGEQCAPRAPRTKATNSAQRPSLQEITDFCSELGASASDAEHFNDLWESNGFTNNGTPIKNWQSVIRMRKRQKCLPSQKNNSDTDHTGSKVKL
jgi:hypothetical protein